MGRKSKRKGAEKVFIAECVAGWPRAVKVLQVLVRGHHFIVNPSPLGRSVDFDITCRNAAIDVLRGREPELKTDQRGCS